MHLVQTVIKLALLIYLVSPPINTQFLTFWSERNGRGDSKSVTGVFLSKHCRLVPETDFEKVSMTKEKDTCIQFFSTNDCTGTKWNKIYIDYFNYESRLVYQSWVLCDLQSVGLNVVIYNRSNWEQEPFKNFRNLCKCVNIPEDLHKHDIIMSTEGKQIILFDEENCTGIYTIGHAGEKFAEKSLQAFDRPRNCPLLTGVMENITFERMTTKNITLKPIEVIPNEIRLSARQNVSVSFKGEDAKTLAVSQFPWTKHLVICRQKNGPILNQKLWENRWENDKELLNDFLESHCKKFDKLHSFGGTSYLERKQTFLSTWNISIAAETNTTITAQRGYVTKSYEYKIQFSITGIWEHKSDTVRANDLENSFPQSGLSLVKKLNATAVLVEVVETFESKYPISTLYKTEVQHSDQHSDSN